MAAIESVGEQALDLIDESLKEDQDRMKTYFDKETKLIKFFCS